MSTTARVLVCIWQIASNRISLLIQKPLRASLFSEPEIIQPSVRTESNDCWEISKRNAQIAQEQTANCHCRNQRCLGRITGKAQAEPTSRLHSKATGRMKFWKGKKEERKRQIDSKGEHINSKRRYDIRKWANKQYSWRTCLQFGIFNIFNGDQKLNHLNSKTPGTWENSESRLDLKENNNSSGAGARASHALLISTRTVRPYWGRAGRPCLADGMLKHSH